MPLCTSAVVGTLAFATRWWRVSMITASVLVSPASTPSQRSAPRIGRASDQGGVFHVVAEGSRTSHREPRRREPQLRGRGGDHDDALATAQTLGRDRPARVSRQDRDEVGHRRAHHAILDGEQELVLELEAQLARAERRLLLDRGRAAHEAVVRTTLDVNDAALPDDD